jgi:hypothetical protein
MHALFVPLLLSVQTRQPASCQVPSCRRMHSKAAWPPETCQDPQSQGMRHESPGRPYGRCILLLSHGQSRSPEHEHPTRSRPRLMGLHTHLVSRHVRLCGCVPDVQLWCICVGDNHTRVLRQLPDLVDLQQTTRPTACARHLLLLLPSLASLQGSAPSHDHLLKEPDVAQGGTVNSPPAAVADATAAQGGGHGTCHGGAAVVVEGCTRDCFAAHTHAPLLGAQWF